MVPLGMNTAASWPRSAAILRSKSRDERTLAVAVGNVPVRAAPFADRDELRAGGGVGRPADDDVQRRAERLAGLRRERRGRPAHGRDRLPAPRFAASRS